MVRTCDGDDNGRPPVVVLAKVRAMSTGIERAVAALAIDCLVRRFSAATRILFLLRIFWNVVALAQLPAPIQPDPKLTP
jgi:hypothetical protein